MTLHLSSLRPAPGGSVIPFFGTQTLVVWAGIENPDISISTVCSHCTPGSRSVGAGGAAAASDRDEEQDGQADGGVHGFPLEEGGIIGHLPVRTREPGSRDTADR